MSSTATPRFLVTGGAGFIGSALVWHLNQSGFDDIVIADYLGTSAKWRNLVPLRYADYVEADDLFPALEMGDLGSFDYVFHLGACSATTEQDAAYLIRNNYEYTKDLARWSIDHGARFTYASSAATYGDGAHGMSDAAELNDLRPLNMYGYSKHLFDLYARRQGWLDKIVGLKYFNVFGPNEDHKEEMRSVVHKSFAQVNEEGLIRLFRSHRPDYTDGEQKRDFLYVKDAVKITLALAMNPEANGLFNVGSGFAHSWNELARAIFAAMDRPANIKYIDMPETLREKYQYFTEANTTKLHVAGYSEPMTSLQDAVRDYVVNYLIPDARLGDERP